MLVKDFITKDISSLKGYSTDSFPGSVPSLMADDSILNALSVVADKDLEFVKVEDSDGNIIGILDRKDIVNALVNMTCMDKPGSLIILEMYDRDYALSEISRIAESNDARIEALLTRYIPLTDRMQLLLKINLEDATAVIRSLERFNYSVIYYSMKAGAVNDSLQQRVDEVLRCFL